MIRNVRGMVFVFLMFAAISVQAQNISVASLKLLENDLTANTAGTMERDQNGEPAALIKVVTTQQGFVFDGGMVGIVKTKQGVGEVWVYVPHGIKKMTIQHPQLGVLRDYYFPIAIDKAKTYEMVLSTGRVETVVTHAVNKQFVVFKVNPTNAIVELNDEMLTVDSEGYATKGVEYGTYNYRVSCANYHTEAGQVNVNADGKAEVEVTLRPNFGWIKFSGDAALNGADVYIDNERAGKLPFVSENLKSGVHRVKIVKNMYKTYEQQVTVNDNETTELSVEMIPNFAMVTLTTDAESEIWIDGVRRNTGKWTGPLELGNYTIEVRKESHRTVSEILRVEDIGEQTIELKSPTPIYASLEISSTPLRATVFIDGEEVGETPLIKNDILIGTHQVTFKKNGFGSIVKTVELKEGNENQVTAELSENKNEVTIMSEPSGADVKIDGEYKGVTPVRVALSNGKYSFSFSKDGYVQDDRVVEVDNETDIIRGNLTSVGHEVDITSTPTNAIVYVDGENRGNTPLELNLSPGSHLIALNKIGYKSHKEYKTVSSTKKNAFHFELSKDENERTRNRRPSISDVEERHFRLGVDLGFSTYGFNYGGELGAMFRNFSLSLGVEGHLMGQYSVMVAGHQENHSIQLLRFSGKLGYTFALGNFKISPQLGLVFGPSFLTGREYVMKEYTEGSLEDKDYIDMNLNIMNFASIRCGFLFGSRFEYVSAKTPIGLHITPEYVVKEGVRVSAGVSVWF